MDLVEGRQCGECKVCCLVPFIDTQEFRKLPGVRCHHLCESGCSIYASRYEACRTYHCGWRYLQFLGDHWRPDRSGVLLAFTPQNELPPGYATGVGFILVAPPPASLSRALYRYVASLIADEVHVMLAIPGPPGHYPAVTLLNDKLRDAAQKHDHGRIEAAFSEALANAQSHRFIPVAAPAQRVESSKP